MRNLEEQIFGVGTSCIHGRFVQGGIWCKILRLAMCWCQNANLLAVEVIFCNLQLFNSSPATPVPVQSSTKQRVVV